MNSKLILAGAALVVLMLIPSGNGIQCHVCSSKDDPACDDPFYYEDAPNKPKTDKFLQDCPSDGKDYFCRKIYQTVRGESRVIRSCGWERHEKDCYSTVLEEYNTYVCQCDEDGCNSASMVSLSLVGVMSTIGLTYLLN